LTGSLVLVKFVYLNAKKTPTAPRATSVMTVTGVWLEDLNALLTVIVHRKCVTPPGHTLHVNIVIMNPVFLAALLMTTVLNLLLCVGQVVEIISVAVLRTLTALLAMCVTQQIMYAQRILGAWEMTTTACKISVMSLITGLILHVNIVQRQME